MAGRGLQNLILTSSPVRSVIQVCGSSIRKDSRHAFNGLAFPCADLVRVQLVSRGDLLNGLVATQGFKRNLRFELIRKVPSFRHLVSLFKIGDTP
jgi:hypothetical protein